MFHRDFIFCRSSLHRDLVGVEQRFQQFRVLNPDQLLIVTFPLDFHEQPVILRREQHVGLVIHLEQSFHAELPLLTLCVFHDDHISNHTITPNG
jgi:hypothetical protein